MHGKESEINVNLNKDQNLIFEEIKKIEINYLNSNQNMRKNFAKVLTEFDNIIIAKIYPARETDDLGISGQSIVDEIKSRGKDAIYIPEFDDIANYIKEHAKPGDLVLTLGAGNVNQIADLLLRK